MGLAVTTWIVPLDGFESLDASPVQWMAERRTSSLDALSLVGSEISGGVVIPALVAVVVIVSALRRRWLLAGFVLGAILLESATYRTTVFFVDRERPHVERLEGLPVDASFPSGHVAASIAVYSGFALLLTSRMTSTRAKALVWAAALAIPPIVAVSRMYRGMHHPLDTLAGVLMGIAALTLAVAPRACDGSGRAQAGGTRSMTTVAVVAHAGKTFDGGLLELRRELERQGVTDPLWYEVPKSRKAPGQFRRAIEEGAELVFVWGGDGTVQRCIDALDGADVPIAIVPAGTANLLASNLDIPKDIEQAVSIGLHGAHRKLDVGRINGERFAVMAGAGFDALMIREADAGLKDRIGRVAYVWTGVNQLGRKPFEAKIKVDGSTWFKGKASCVLLGNFGELFADVEAFEDARPDDGMLELGVVTADSVLDWLRTIGRTVVGASSASPFVQVTKARSVNVRFDRKVLYELDGGDRKEVKKLDVEIEPAAVEVCVPAGSA